MKTWEGEEEKAGKEMAPTRDCSSESPGQLGSLGAQFTYTGVFNPKKMV